MLRHINLHVTNNCNKNCEFCFEDRNYINPTYIDVDKFLLFAKNNNIKSIGLVGGEPLLHPKINYLIKELKQSNIEIYLMTNGILLNKLTSIPDKIVIGIKNEYDLIDIMNIIEKKKLNDKIIFSFSFSNDNILNNFSKKMLLDDNIINKTYSVPAYFSKSNISLDNIKDIYKFLINDIPDIEGFGKHYAISYLNNKKIVHSCTAGVNVYPDGTIQLCDLNNQYIEGLNIDTIKEFNLQDILLKRNNNMNEFCKECTFCYFKK